MQVDTTRALIKALPQLFTKHQTDTPRMAELLKLPQFMRLDLYLEMRMMTVSLRFRMSNSRLSKNSGPAGI